MILEFTVSQPTDIKSFLLKKDFSLNIINKLLKEKLNIYINQKPYKGNYKLNSNDRLKIVLENETTTVKPIDKPVDIIYEDEFIIAVKKPENLSVIPSKLHFNDNLSARVLNYFILTHQNTGIHIVNRLDLMTRGIVVFAKHQFIHNLISKTRIIKKYRCTVTGILKDKDGTIVAKIDREHPDSVKRKISDSGKTAITKYKVIKEENGNSVLDIELLTGRTHQIRVHFAYLSHPLIGDKLYGENNGEFDLCCYYLNFYLPFNDKNYQFTM